jgi:hypothetical protein
VSHPVPTIRRVTTRADYEAACAAADEAISARGLGVFDVFGGRSVDEFGSPVDDLPVAAWDGSELGPFLDLAAGAGVSLVYRSAHRLGDDRDGELIAWRIAWVKEAVAHVYELLSPRYEDVEAEQASASARGRPADSEEDLDDPDYEGDTLLAEQMAGDPRLDGANTTDEIQVVVTTVMADHPECAGKQYLDSMVLRAYAGRLARRLAPGIAADERFRVAKRSDQMVVAGELLPEWRFYNRYGGSLMAQVAREANDILEPELAQEAHRLFRQGLPRTAIGGRLHRSAQVISRLLAEFPATDEPEGTLL